MRARWSHACRAHALTLACSFFVAAAAARAESVRVASLRWTEDRPSVISVSLAGDLSSEQRLTDVASWHVRSRDLKTHATTFAQIRSVELLSANQQVNLVLAEPLEPWNADADLREVFVTFFGEGDARDVALHRGAAQSQPAAAQRGYQAARGKDDADIYLSGGLTAAQGTRPSFTADVKLRHEVRTASGGRFNAAFDLLAANEPNIDPDSIKGKLGYERVFASGFVLRWDTLTGEFSRRDDFVNLTTAARVVWVPRSLRLRPRTYLAVEPFWGFDAGRKLAGHDAGADETVARPFTGANAYLLALQPGAGLERITLGVEYALRLPLTDEPYSVTRDGRTQSSLTRRARPNVRVDLAFQFLAGYGFTVQYRNGSEPPAFARVEHRLALGFTVQRKRR